MLKKPVRNFASLILAVAIALTGVVPAFAAPPSNDDFDFATSIGGLPATITQETFDATAAFDDPITCTNNGSVWFSFTPSSNVTIQANTFGSNYDTVLSVYTGTRGSLTQVPGGCNDDYQGLQSRVVFNAVGGTTYYLLVGFCCGTGGTGGANLTLTLQEHVPQPPVANFFYFPSDPSINDTVTFCDSSFDPEGVGIQSMTWDFGDGTTSTINCAYHNYAADGDYTVQHSVTTFDGRSAASSTVVQVRTHDVSVQKVMAPRSAMVGQSKQITVAIRNTYYAETVRIDLFKSAPNGSFEFVGSSTQFVPVRQGNRTSEFVFNYTFTPQDAQVGKVVFRVFVTIITGRDTFPADNEAFSSPPTSVR